MDDEPAQFVFADAVAAAESEPPRRKERKRRGVRLVQCQNCGSPVTGQYCAHCGQAAIDYHRSLRHLMADVAEAFLNWDSKFTRTAALLFVNPGLLCRNFIAGMRQRYFHPLRLYLVASILFFFAVTYWAKSANIQGVGLTDQMRAEIAAELDRSELTESDRERLKNLLKLERASPAAGHRRDPGGGITLPSRRFTGADCHRQNHLA